MLIFGVVLVCVVVGGSNGVVMVMLFLVLLLLLLLIVLLMIVEVVILMVMDFVFWFVEVVEWFLNLVVIGFLIVFELVDFKLKILIVNVVYCFLFNKNICILYLLKS